MEKKKKGVKERIDFFFWIRVCKVRARFLRGGDRYTAVFTPQSGKANAVYEVFIRNVWNQHARLM